MSDPIPPPPSSRGAPLRQSPLRRSIRRLLDALVLTRWGRVPLQIAPRLRGGARALRAAVLDRPALWVAGAVQCGAVVAAVGMFVHAGARSEPVAVVEPPPLSPCPEWMPCVYIEGGEFDMGAEDLGEASKPVHRVKVASFWMGKSEVTNAQYRRCVEAGKCTAVDWGKCLKWSSKDGSEFQGDAQPVVCVDWRQAKAFAEWVTERMDAQDVKGRLPSDAEWEYAARGRGRSVKYPWGDQEPDCDHAVFAGEAGRGCGRDATADVCAQSGEAGNTPEGLCDMAGNVWEWVEDCWHASYVDSPSDSSIWNTNCQDLFGNEDSGGSYRGGRGGGWGDDASGLRASHRGWNGYLDRLDVLGFRVVVPAPARSRGVGRPP